MNPQTAMSYILSLFTMSTSMVTQGVNLHRELRPPQQQAQAMPRSIQIVPCGTFGARTLTMVTTNGQHQQVCVLEEQR